MKRITLDDVIQHLCRVGVNASSEGLPSMEISGMRALHDLEAGFIGFYRGCNGQDLKAMMLRNGIVLAKDIIRGSVSDLGLTFIWVDNPDLAACFIGQLFVEPMDSIIHPSALIDPSVKLGNNCHIGPNVVIERDVVIGDNVVIEANSVLKNCSISDNSHIHPGVTIGSPGLGSHQDAKGRWVHFPHFGRVKIGMGVVVQDNSVIARGSLQNTVLHDHVVIGPLSAIAHNVVIEKAAFVGQCVTIAGSVVIGEGAKIWGNSAIRDGLSIGRNCTVGMGAVVVKNVPDGLTVIGNPAHVLVK